MTGSARFLSFLAAAGLVVGTAALTTDAAAGPGAPAPDRTGDAIVAERVPAPERRAALDYWTPERMAAAQPLDLTIDGPAPQGATKTIAKKVKKPYDRPNGKKAATGVVFFTTPTGPFRCSGHAVQGESEVAVWTAGHCVYNAPDAFSCTEPPPEPPAEYCTPKSGPAAFMQNIVFVPAYRAGGGKERPFGTFPAVLKDAAGPWKMWGNFRYDYAAFTVGNPSPPGPSLDAVVFERDLTTGYSLVAPLPRFKVIGYPAGAPFKGKAQWKCTSDLRGQDQRLAEAEIAAGVIEPATQGPLPLKVRCDMTGGSSGGGWRLSGAIGSNVSYGWRDKPKRQYGPYLDSAAQELLDSLT